MKLKAGYVLRTVAGQNVVIPTGSVSINFNGIMTLNKTGKVIFEALSEDLNITELSKLIQDKFEVDREIATQDVLDFIQVLKERNMLE